MLLFSSRTCPTCRTATSINSLTKLFFEIDDNKANLNLEEILKTNDELSQKLKDEQEKCKELERRKQLDEMAIAGLNAIKKDSQQKIVELNHWIKTLKLDLLAEKQLRRIHQLSLQDFDPQNENYNTANIKLEVLPEPVNALEALPKPTNGPLEFSLQLNCEAKVVDNGAAKSSATAPYIVPSKIQKAGRDSIKLGPDKMQAYRNKRSLWKNLENKPVAFQFKTPEDLSQPSTSAAVLSKNQKRIFGEGLSFISPIATTASTSDTSHMFNPLMLDNPTFPSPAPGSTSTFAPIVLSSPLRNHRDPFSFLTSNNRNQSVGPKISDR